MDAEALNALADRVEALTGPDREVDAAIVQSVFPEQWQKLRMEAGLPCGAPDAVMSEGAREYVKYRSRYWYTSSLDAAMSLVPEGRLWYVANTSSGAAMAEVIGRRVRAATPALALTAAAFRARAAMLESAA